MDNDTYSTELKELNSIKKSLLMNEAFGLFSSLLCGSTIEFTDDKDKVETLLTNGNYIKIDITFWRSISKVDKIFCVARQLWHIALLHPIRGYDKVDKMWNLAAAIVANNTLIQGGFKVDKIKPLHYPDLYEYNTEEIYQKLMMGYIPPPKQPDPLQNNLDCSKNLSHEQKQQVELEQKSQMAGFAGMSGIGNVPGELKLIIDKFLKPRVKFGNILKRFLNELGEETRTYLIPNRRSEEDFILPSVSEQEGKLEHINFYVDCSGSISDEEIIIFNSEIKQIKELYNPKILTLVCFDTKIHKIINIKETDTFDYVDVVGRGGTDFDCVFEHIDKIKPTLAIIFTDCDVYNIPPKPKSTEVVWLVNTENPSNKPTYGKFIYVDTEAYD